MAVCPSMHSGEVGVGFKSAPALPTMAPGLCEEAGFSCETNAAQGAGLVSLLNLLLFQTTRSFLKSPFAKGEVQAGNPRPRRGGNHGTGEAF